MGYDGVRLVVIGLDEVRQLEVRYDPARYDVVLLWIGSLGLAGRGWFSYAQFRCGKAVLV